jgi:hypothetical protein
MKLSNNYSVSVLFAQKILGYCLASLAGFYSERLMEIGDNPDFSRKFAKFHLVKIWFEHNLNPEIAEFVFENIVNQQGEIIITAEDLYEYFRAVFLYCYSELTELELGKPKPRIRLYTPSEENDPNIAFELPSEFASDLEKFLLEGSFENPLQASVGWYNTQELDSVQKVLENYFK